MAGASPGWFPPPQPGDIAWCRFPEERLPEPGPKARPALVLRVGEHLGRPVVVVAYGTSRKVDRLYPGEFIIAPSDREAYDAAGLIPRSSTWAGPSSSTTTTPGSRSHRVRLTARPPSWACCTPAS